MRTTKMRVTRIIGTALTLVLMAGCATGGSDPSSDEASHADQTTAALDTKASYSGTEFPMTLTDFVGDTLTLDAQPEHVAILSGTPLSIFYDAGGEAIATATLTDNVKLTEEHAAEITALPELGPPYGIDSEALIALDPDLVITLAGAQDTLSSQLRGMGIPTFTSTIKNLDDLQMAYQIFGAISGTSEHATQRFQQIQADTQHVLDRWPAGDDTSVAILFVTAQSLTVKLDTSIAGDVTRMLSITNIASGLTPDNPGSENAALDVEAIVAAQPDYVLVTSMIGSNDEAKAKLDEQFASNQAWQAVDAIRNDRVIYLPQQYFLYNAGPFYADAVEYLAACIHPDIYGEPVDPA